MKKQVIKSALIYFLIGATVNGSVYKLITYTTNKELLDALVINLIVIITAFIFSFVGSKFKNNNNKKI